MASRSDRPKLVIDFNGSKPLGEVVYVALREAIIKNQFKSGERLMETELADEMMVSRTPVREAVRKLQSEGYVIMLPRKGTYVTSLTIQDVNDVFEIRGALESMAAARAAERASGEEIAEIRKFIESEAVLWDSTDLARTIRCDIQFHSMVYRASKNTKVENLINDLREQTQRLRSSTLSRPGQVRFALEEHRQILSAIEARDAEGARDASIAHVERSREVMLELLSYQT
ncbi:MAG: GntR family transcriptional regulator [Clostridiales bacterium]|nr:GntR family transcriptional regulator [Clostridiales bacterium]